MSGMLNILHKSILRELILSFLLALAFLNSILMMEKLVRLSRFLSGVGASVLDMAKIILYIQPQILQLTLPMSLLLATLLVYGRMNLDNEIIIMRSSGMDLKKIALPVFYLGLFAFIAGIAVSFSLGPKSSISLRTELTRIIASRSAVAIEEGTFNTSFRDIVIMVKGRKDPETFEKIFIYDNRKKDEPKVLMAKEGTFYLQDGLTIGLHLRDGYINITKGLNTTELFFEQYRMTLALDAESPAPKKSEFTPGELLHRAAEEEIPKKKTALYLEFHRRLSLPAVCLVLIFLGSPLSLISGKSGRLGGLAVGLAVFTLYYLLLIYSENLVMADKLHHGVGAWTPFLVLAAISSMAFRKGDSL